MGKVHTIGKNRIVVYADDHAPPHFHIRGVDSEALVEIATLRVLKGEVPSKAALDWARENIETIKAEWNRLYPGSQVS